MCTAPVAAAVWIVDGGLACAVSPVARVEGQAGGRGRPQRPSPRLSCPRSAWPLAALHADPPALRIAENLDGSCGLPVGLTVWAWRTMCVCGSSVSSRALWARPDPNNVGHSSRPQFRVAVCDHRPVCGLSRSHTHSSASGMAQGEQHGNTLNSERCSACSCHTDSHGVWCTCSDCRSPANGLAREKRDRTALIIN